MTAELTVTCGECAAVFTARSPRARFCSARCRKASSRRPSEPAGTAEGAPIEGRRPEDPLVVAVQKELEHLSAVDTVDGQIAVHLARQVKAAKGSSASSLAKELRTVLDRAAASAAPQPPAPEDPPTGPEPDDDEVTRLRRNRERKAREASAG